MPLSLPFFKSLIALRVRQLWRHLSARRHRQFGLLFALMLASAFAEIVSLGALLPFLATLAAPDKVFAQPKVQALAHWLGITSADKLLAPLTLLFVAAALTAGAIRLLLLWVTTRLTSAAGADLSMEMYRRTLYQPYHVHMSRNSSELISAITNKTTAIIFEVLLPVLTLTNSLLLITVFSLALIIINPLVALTVTGGFGLCYVLIARFIHRRLAQDGQIVAHEHAQLVRALQEGLGGIRDVLLDGAQRLYCEVYHRADRPMRLAQGRNVFISGSPRFAMEAIGMAIVALLAYALTRSGGIAEALPVLGALALGAQRLLPALQQGYSAWTLISGQQASLVRVLALLDQPVADDADSAIAPAALPFNQQIELKTMVFRYAKDAPPVLNIDHLAIPKGARIGFTGTTGSGKSTLLDIIMGLLLPSEGELLVDGQVITSANCRAWQRNIAHVPQSIFLIDGTIAENIALGVAAGDVDMARVRQAAQQAQIADFIESQPEGYNIYVGERGIRVSGGQRQRIGIARALYRNANILILDEATSALDNETETAVMAAIDGLKKDLTVLMVAHRLTTLAKCDVIIDLKRGEIEKRDGMPTHNLPNPGETLTRVSL